jgi:hypothetical protein
MSLIPFLLMAAGGWIELAAMFEAHYGQAWAYRACGSIDGLCNYHTPIFYGAVALAVASLLFNWLRNA